MDNSKEDFARRHREEIELEKKVLKRMKEKESVSHKSKTKKPSKYITFSNRFFSGFSVSLSNKFPFKNLRENLIKANLSILPVSYISAILFATVLSAIVGIFIFVFFLFFNIGIKLPIITGYGGELGVRALKIFWIILVVPIFTFLAMLYYPSLEKSSIKRKINQELPFVAIHLSAIAGSMVEPSKIFQIITLTKEYPNTSKEFTKVINEIHIYGYNLVNALRESAENTSSEKLRDLFNGLATTITTGGSMQIFFEKRAQSLLLDYKLERERYTRISETFMDIYISVVIAAPMVLMLLFLMIRISGLGISISTGAITAIIISIVSIINIGFLIFLKLRQPEE